MRRAPSTLACIVLAASAIGSAAAAQTSAAPPNALQGFANNRDKPVHIKAQSFELRDKDRKATFVGNVHVTQGDTVIRCKSLVVTYETNAMSGSTGTTPAQGGATGGSNNISKLEALGGVIVTQKDQTATGDTGYFDVRANTVTLVGNVVVSQGGNVMRGQRLFVDLNTGVSRVEAGKPGQPVEMMIPQNSNSSNPSKPGAPGQEIPRPNFLRPGQSN
jgi:lipopolysaccharide export system protein LptA